MNTTIQHISTSRSGERSAGSKVPRPKSKLPPAAAAFAKQMGLDLSGFEAEADDIWSMLTNMSEDNPVEYENFVREQIAEGHALTAAMQGDAHSSSSTSPNESSSTSNSTNAEKETRYFRPVAGFCVRCMTTWGDGLKVRMDGEGKKLFVNICSFDAIEPPRDKAGRPVLEHRLSADGMEFPLLVGPTRSHTDSEGAECIAVDVIFHPSVVFHCKKEYLFKRQVVELALCSVMEETEVRFDPKRYDVLKAPEYAAGRGVDDSTPVLFPVNHALKQSDPKQRNPSETASSSSSHYLEGGSSRRAAPAEGAAAPGAFNLTMSTPQSLLSMSEAEKEIAEDSLLNNIKLTSSKTKSASKDASKPQKPLVQEVIEESSALLRESSDVGAGRPDLPPSEAVSARAASSDPAVGGGGAGGSKGPPLIKKGFLSTAKNKGVSLYPEGGSSEGAGGAKGGTYQRFMERCKIVDTSTMQAGNAPPPAPVEPVSSNSNSAVLSNTSSAAPRVKNSLNTSVPATADKPLSEREHRKIDELFSGLDEDFGASVTRMENVRRADKMTDQLGDLARILSGGGKPDDGRTCSAGPAVGAAMEALSILGGSISERTDGASDSGDKTFVFADGSEVIMRAHTDSSVSIDVSKTNASDLALSVKGLTAAQIGAADLKISDTCVELSFGANCGAVRLYLPHPHRFAVDRTTAKMSKKRGTVEVFTSQLL